MTAREVIGEYLAAMQRGDRDTALSFYAEDVVIRIPGRSPFAGEHRGREAFLAYVSAALQIADGGAEAELVDMLDNGGERVALLLHERLRGVRGELRMRRANVYTVRGERIVELRIYEHDQYAVDAYLGG